MKTGVKSIVVLGIICLVSSALLGGVNHFTAPVIEKTTKERSEAACFEVMPSGQAFEEVTVSGGTLPKAVTSVYKEKNGAGYVIKVSTKGYDSGLVIMCGISPEGKVTGTKILSSNETPSIGGQCAKPAYSSQYEGKDKALNGIEAISGATLTSTGYYNAVKTAFEAFETLSKGGNK
jgi:electron transport complex protein RnfG